MWEKTVSNNEVKTYLIKLIKKENKVIIDKHIPESQFKIESSQSWLQQKEANP